MATDYDLVRRSDDDVTDDSIEDLKAARVDQGTSARDQDGDEDAGEARSAPGADLAGEDLTVAVVPVQAGEFTCSVCFLVHHRTQLAGYDGDRPVCADCAV